MINYPITRGMFGHRTSIYAEKNSGKFKPGIFGYQQSIKNYLRNSACCVIQGGGSSFSGNVQFNVFFPTIWKHNLQNVLISKMAFGEDCCNNP